MFDHIPTPNRKDLRLFGIVLALILFVIGGHAWWKHPDHVNWRHYLLYCAPIALLLALAAPQTLFWVHRSLAYATAPIGWAIRNIILGLTLIFVLTPVRLFSSMGDKDKMQRKLEPERKSYWLEADKPKEGSDHYRKLY